MLKLLVSVIDEEDAREAYRGGADIIDVKNPDEGALGANFPWVLRKIRQTLGPSMELSATIGDMPNLPGTASFAALGAAKSGADYVKIGLYGPKSFGEALYLVKNVNKAVKEFTPKVKVVAACYGDYTIFGGLNPSYLPRLASEARVEGVLVDVKGKDEKKLFHYLDDDQITRIVEEAHRRGLTVALAGGLDRKDVVKVKGFEADIMGVRRAVCEKCGDGYGKVRSRFIRDLVKKIRG